MGAYSNPDVNVGIDRQSGKMIGQAIAGIGQKIGSAYAQGAEKIAAAQKEVAERKRKEAEKARIRAEQNWRIHKAVESQRTQAVVDFESTLESQNIDVESLNGSFKGVIDELYEAKDRLAQSRGDYEGRKDDEAMIRNNTAFISGLQNNFISMNMLMSTWKEKFKLRDVPGGIDSSTSNPLFAAMMEIGEGGSEGIGAGKIGWETRTGPGGKKQLFQVARSEEIRKLNWINGGKKGALENASDTYELNYDQVRSFLDDDDNNPNTFGPFNLVPDDTAERKKDLKSAKIIGEDGKITLPDEQGQGGYFIKGSQFVGDPDGLRPYWDQKTWPNTQKIQGQIGKYAKSSAQADLGFGGSSITANSSIRANALKKEITVKMTDDQWIEFENDDQRVAAGWILKGDKWTKKATQYYIPQYGKRNDQGELTELPDFILGDSVTGIMSQDNEEGTGETDGYSPKEYEKYIKFTEWQYMSQAGAFAAPTNIIPEKREYITTSSPSGPGAELSTNESVVYNRLTKGPEGFADFFEENTTNKTGKMSEDGSTFTYKNGRKTETVDMTNEQEVIGLLKVLLDGEKLGLGTGKDKEATILKLVEKYRKDKFGQGSSGGSSGGQGGSTFKKGELN